MMDDHETFTRTLEVALAYSLAHLDGLKSKPVGPTAELGDLRARIGRPLADTGIEPWRVIQDLVTDTEGGIVGSAGGRFFGWVMGGALPAALAADWLTSVWDQNAAIYACGPAEAVIEEVTGEWLKHILGLPAGASFAFVTGTQMAHVICLAAARHQLLERAGWDVEERGLHTAPAIRVLTSTERHGSIERALRLLGLGKGCLVDLPCDTQGRMQSDHLEKALISHSTAPVIVVLQAGDLNIGAFDPFEELIPIARRHGAWVHIDGAFGLWAGASPTYRHLVRGVQAADSWTTDGHKWLNTPFDCGYAFVASQEAHKAAISHRASYLIHVGDARDQIDWNPEWSRRGRAVATYAALRQLGRSGLTELIDRTCHLARALVNAIGALPGAEIIWTPTINQGLVRFLDSKSHATNDEHDRQTDAVIADVVSSGEAFFGGTTWRGKRCMRISVCNWQTNVTDAERAIRAVATSLHNRGWAAAVPL